MTEKEIIEGAQRGDRDAFNALMELYQNQVFKIVYGMLSDYEDASDAAQEVFVKVYKSIASFKGQSSFTTWLYVICRNVCNDMLRKRQRQGMTLSVYSDDEQSNAPINDVKSEEPTPEEQVEMNERQRAVRDAIDALKSEYREVILYCDIEGLPYDEVAKIIKCPVGTVKSRLNRARSALRKILTEKRELFL